MDTLPRKISSDTRAPKAAAPRLRDTDSVFRAHALKAAAWGLFPAIGMGLAVTLMGGLAVGILVGVAVAGGVTVTALLVAETAGRATDALAHPKGGRHRSQHSLPRSLLARGRPEEAVTAFELASAEDPADPDPYLGIARIYRDHLGRPEDALRWFRRARDHASLTPGEQRVLVREIVELGRKHLGDAARAAPDLARHAESFEGTKEGEWALRELAELKRAMQAQGSGPS